MTKWRKPLKDGPYLDAWLAPGGWDGENREKAGCGKGCKHPALGREGEPGTRDGPGPITKGELGDVTWKGPKGPTPVADASRTGEKEVVRKEEDNVVMSVTSSTLLRIVGSSAEVRDISAPPYRVTIS